MGKYFEESEIHRINSQCQNRQNQKEWNHEYQTYNNPITHFPLKTTTKKIPQVHNCSTTFSAPLRKHPNNFSENVIETITKERFVKEHYKTVNMQPLNAYNKNNTSITKPSSQRFSCYENCSPNFQRKAYYPQIEHKCQLPNKNHSSLNDFLHLNQNNNNLICHAALKNRNYYYETADGIFITSQPIKLCFPDERQQNVITTKFTPEQYYQQTQSPNIYSNIPETSLRVASSQSAKTYRAGSPQPLTGAGIITNTEDGFTIELNVEHFDLKDIKISLFKDELTVKGERVEKDINKEQTLQRNFSRIYKITNDIRKDTLKSFISKDGILVIIGKRNQWKQTNIDIQSENEFKKSSINFVTVQSKLSNDSKIISENYLPKPHLLMEITSITPPPILLPPSPFLEASASTSKNNSCKSISSSKSENNK